MVYIGYHFNVEPRELGTEILIAELGEKAFESFEETATGVSAYVQKDLWTEDILEDVFILQSEQFTITYRKEEIAQVNWNEEWEKNFDPIDVDGICYVRAPFHEKTSAQYDIVIEPKMSFGTGHHETTFMMIRQILNNDMQDKVVLDMGCGTAILAILAAMRGAKHVDAIDIDNWCYLNSIENAERNNCANVEVFEGDASIISKEPKYNVILANINRNILLNDMDKYIASLYQGGEIYFSGFYTEDITAIKNCAEKIGLVFESSLEKNNWVSLKFIKG
ncbi:MULTISPECIES: 50S ribosomal protein L11 methyltransferase [Myroides]|uniref:Ribosomal protein L11 methyltransferase n=2 Tax=Myroides odoratimimus TaxID=76832 RepID=A0AAI8C586_9FLAO|nr:MULTISPECIES: 50S ribosomal protein L11 methyltransferase [Myroides]ALU26337.1 ribosomal protein L11 methyltransferase [Myroides odoratimimus]APA92389.1 ribosomal protein L11 methyltransferase [Myroides sp. ZB35]EHO12182.1 ribosomal protein L11 methyltransferase [Myroides odoratimimus CCUG 10230]EKB03092.1 ribosomal protein L11 methyltransferase [Myroides odoratimimus CCUG 3837]EPH11538.1 ribosomal protein L11 methyltransferase [Myroides odoratimimus CCUG 12700]